MSHDSPFGEHKEDGVHLIICKDGRHNVQVDAINFVRTELKKEPFLTAFWGGSLEILSVGSREIYDHVFKHAPEIIGAPREVILINHIDCAGVLNAFKEIETHSPEEIKKHREILHAALEILRVAFPKIKATAYILKDKNHFEQVF